MTDSLRILLRDGSDRMVSCDEAVDLVRTRAQYVRWYDALPSGNPDVLELLDLAFPAFLAAVPNFRALLADNGWDNLSRSLREASDVLRKVPASEPLASWADTEENRSLLFELFALTTGGGNKALPGFGPAMSTKMLHKKRPALIPIIDSWQLEAWGKPAVRWRTADLVEVVFAIRGQLVGHEKTFSMVAAQLRAADPTIPHLSAVRIYDILFWEHSRP